MGELMTNEELIAEARKASRAVYLAVPGPVADDLSRIITGLAAALEAALPKEVQTVEELDALPVGAVVRNADGEVFERNRPHAWATPGTEVRYASSWIAVPATVLHIAMQGGKG